MISFDIETTPVPEVSALEILAPEILAPEILAQGNIGRAIIGPASIGVLPADLVTDRRNHFDPNHGAC
jgi:hypothetical protein